MSINVIINSEKYISLNVKPIETIENIKILISKKEVIQI